MPIALHLTLPILAILIWSALLQIGVGRIAGRFRGQFRQRSVVVIILMAATLASVVLIGIFLSRIDEYRTRFNRNIMFTFMRCDKMDVVGLAAHGCDVDNVGWCGSSALCNSAQPDVMNYLALRRLHLDPDDPEVAELLFVFAQVGSSNYVEALIDAGANVNCQNQATGQTPLDIAIQAKRPYVALLLKRAGAVSAADLAKP